MKIHNSPVYNMPTQFDQFVKQVVSSPGLMDFAVRQVDSIHYMVKGLVNFLGAFKKQAL